MTLVQAAAGTLAAGVVGAIIFAAPGQSYPEREKTIATCQAEAIKANPNAKRYVAGGTFMTCMKAKGFKWTCERMQEDLAGFFFIGFVRFKQTDERPEDVQFHRQLIECFK